VPLVAAHVVVAFEYAASLQDVQAQQPTRIISRIFGPTPCSLGLFFVGLNINACFEGKDPIERGPSNKGTVFVDVVH